MSSEEGFLFTKEVILVIGRRVFRLGSDTKVISIEAVFIYQIIPEFAVAESRVNHVVGCRVGYGV